jgi:hypothetical protein
MKTKLYIGTFIKGNKKIEEFVRAEDVADAYIRLTARLSIVLNITISDVRKKYLPTAKSEIKEVKEYGKD